MPIKSVSPNRTRTTWRDTQWAGSWFVTGGRGTILARPATGNRHRAASFQAPAQRGPARTSPDTPRQRPAVCLRIGGVLGHHAALNPDRGRGRLGPGPATTAPV